MDIQLRQRLLAAIVILALIVIFVPMLFRKHAQDKIVSVTTFPTAPVKPNVNEMTPAATQQDSTTDQSTSDTAMPTTDQTAPISTQDTVQISSQPELPMQQTNDTAPISQQQPTDTQQTPLNVQQPASQDNSLTSDGTNDQTVQQTNAPASPTNSDKQMSVMSIKPANKIKSVSPIILSQQNKRAFAQHIHIRKSDVNSNNVLPDVTASQKAQIKSAKAMNQAWVVQLGSFANQKNAVSLVKDLRSKGFSAFSYPSHQGHIINHRVYVGPMIQKNEAQGVQEKINHKLHLKSILVSFNATHID